MADSTIIQNLMFQLGQSQGDRLPPELGRHFADVDERSQEDLLTFAQTLAQFVNYYRTSTDAPIADWQSFFPPHLNLAQLTASDNADVSPHLALLLTFLELYQQPQRVLNEIPGRHLTFYYQDVLRLQPRPAVPDTAHVLFELKKRATPTLITPQTLISAGKDATGVELLYAPLRDTVVNLSQVAAVRSLFVDRAGRGTVRYAPIANSSDGVGSKLPAADPKWSGFGHADLPAAEVGFALAAPVLRMQEGQRRVTVILTLKDRGSLTTAALRDGFDGFITAEKAWFGPQTVSPTVTSDHRLSFELILNPEDPPIVDYDREIHGYQYGAQAPIVQVLLKPDAPNLGYLDLRGIEIEQAQVKVSVSQIHSLTAENDRGRLNPAKVFFPFGLEPATGSTFRVGYAEALHKKLSRLSLILEWADLPASGFASHYANYNKPASNSGFTASVSFQDGGRWQVRGESVALFNSSNGVARRTLAFTPGDSNVSTPVNQAKQIYALHQAGSFWAQLAVNQFVLKQPILGSFKASTAEPDPGVITLTLNQDFLHRTYRRKSTEDMLNYSNQVVKASLDKANYDPPSSPPPLLNEPYTPKLQSLALAYDAYSEAVPLSTNRLEDFANPDVQFFHLAYFGQRREHRYQRGQFNFLTRLGVTLVPTYPHAGELLVGLSGLQPQDSVSLLFQVAEGSANPDRQPENLTWFALCDNYWKPLGTGEVVLDTTHHLRTSGIIQFVIPPEATLVNTIFPSEESGPEGQRLWLKAAIANHVDAVSQMITIAANAVAVRFVDRGNDPNHLQTPLAAGRLTKVKGGLATVKTIRQPFASVGHIPPETEGAFHSRVAERLRHKHRAITTWDYERLVLNRFKQVYKVKVIPHARAGQWLAPGHVLIVVVADLTNQNALDPLQPKVDLNTLTQIQDYLQQRAGMQVQLQVKNPRYQRIQADFKVRFRPGDVNFYRNALNQALIDHLSPWLTATQPDISFGGKVYKSVLLDFVEELDYVDYLTEFKLYSYDGDSPSFRDLNRVEPTTPDTILVSESCHRITPIFPA